MTSNMHIPQSFINQDIVPLNKMNRILRDVDPAKDLGAAKLQFIRDGRGLDPIEQIHRLSGHPRTVYFPQQFTQVLDSASTEMVAQQS